MAVLVLAEHDEQGLNGATANAVSAAAKIGGPVDVVVAGSSCKAAAEQAAKIDGVARVLLADAPHLDHQLAEEVAALLHAMMAHYDTLVAAATTRGKNIMPRVAATLDVMQVSDIIAVHTPDTFDRPTYAGNAVTTVVATDAKKVITIRTTTFAAAGARSGAPAPIETVPAPAPVGLSRFDRAEIARSERPELAAARIVVSGGRGMQSGENFKTLIEPLADQLGAAVGASRAAVDAGFVPNDYQVGQTGKVVAPDLYIAVGISGAIQHLAGMKDSKVIVAINKDGEAPIFQVADYGLVGDLFKVVPELTAELKKAQS
jgi:electron transfer flavoprotein alpha subunit